MAIYMVFLSRGHYGFSFIRGDEPGSVASGTIPVYFYSARVNRSDP